MTAFNSTKNDAQYVTKQQTAFGVTSGNWLNFLDALGVQENSGKYAGFGGANFHESRPTPRMMKET